MDNSQSVWLKVQQTHRYKFGIDFTVHKYTTKHILVGSHFGCNGGGGFSRQTVGLAITEYSTSTG